MQEYLAMLSALVRYNVTLTLLAVAIALPIACACAFARLSRIRWIALAMRSLRQHVAKHAVGDGHVLGLHDRADDQWTFALGLLVGPDRPDLL